MKFSINLVNTLGSVLVILLTVSSISALYEDQIGKFDWLVIIEEKREKSLTQFILGDRGLSEKLNMLNLIP